MNKKLNHNNIFENYGEYLHITRYLSLYQKNKIFDSLQLAEKNRLLKSYEQDGWSDLVESNVLDQKLDLIKNQFNKDLIELRIKINSGSTIRVKEAFWKFVEQEFSSVSNSHKSYILGSVSCVQDPVDSKWVIIKKRSTNG